MQAQVIELLCLLIILVLLCSIVVEKVADLSELEPKGLCLKRAKSR